jgi:hypothetical protein
VFTAILKATARTLSSKPRYRRKKEFVEGDYYEAAVSIENNGDQPFPGEEMYVEVNWDYPTNQANLIKFILKKHEVLAGKSVTIAERFPVLASGYVLAKADFRPFGAAPVFYDSRGNAVRPMFESTIDGFKAVSTVELETLLGLYLSAIGTILAVAAVLISLLFRR